VLGTVAQVMALTAYGNATLQGADSIPVPAFYPGNSAFQFCEYVRFVDVIGSGPSTQVQPWAEDPNAWFDRLSQLAGQLLAASQLGWVFGGMGSWNDVGSDVSKDPDYQRLSDTLFTLLPRTYVAVADTTMRR